jgi:hypothetical protein
MLGIIVCYNYPIIYLSAISLLQEQICLNLKHNLKLIEMRHFTILLVILSLTIPVKAQKARMQDNPPPCPPAPYIAGTTFQTPTGLKGGGDIFWKEEFDWQDSTSQLGWLLPTGWTLEDPTDIGYNWHWANDTLKGVYTNEPPLASTSVANGFLALNLDGYNQDIGDYNNYIPVDNSIISPPIDCSGRASVLVRVEQNFRYWSEADMTFEVSNDNGVHWASYDMKMGTLYSERVGHVPAGGKVDLYINITDVAAGMSNVQFKITWKNARLYYWMIDDIAFMEGWENDLQMLYYEADYDNGTQDKEGFFYAVPKEQISGYNMMGIIRNFGNADQANTHFNVKVMKNNEYIFDQNSDPVYLSTLITDTFKMQQQFVPEDFGHYRMDFSALMNNEDEIPADNYASLPFNITDSVYSRCDDTAEVNFSTWGWYTYGHEGDQMGTWYTFKNDVEVNSISCYISSADILSTFRFVLLGYNAEEDNTFELLSSDYQDMDSTILKNHWVTLPLIKDGEGEFLKAGDSYMACIEFWNNMDFEEAYNSNRYAIGSDRSDFYPSGKCWFFQTEVGEWWSSGSDLFMIRMNLNDHSNLVDGSIARPVTGTDLYQNYPNPVRSATTISYTLGEASDVRLVIRDITGRVVWHSEFSGQEAGKHQVDLDAGNFAPGTYFYTLTGGSFSKTLPMTVEN